MRRMVLFASILLTLAAACTTVREPARPTEVQDGISFTGWWHEAFEGPGPEESMTNLADTGAGWVGIVTTWYQARIASTRIHPAHKTPTEEGLVHMIRTAHDLGLKVMLKPHIDLARDPAYYRPQIGTEWDDPAACDRWFASYRRFIFHFADIAEAEGVEQFAVGTELAGTSGQAERWREIVRGVRDRFSGTLVYASLVGGEEIGLQWWDAVDLIGVDVYYPLTDQDDPTLQELKDAWAPHVQEFADLSAAWDDKPIVFTEIGYRSIDGGLHSQRASHTSAPSGVPADRVLSHQADESLELSREDARGLLGG